ncbi:hypothetical protein ACHAWO_011603 [Cyclotella atomus]|jgi:hypothetical protein|uniref:HMG box domain-containing protein n=1 Tax=Cyclotella atomus TaxID=382360 RepID=A0ABD3PQF0_9STRA
MKPVRPLTAYQLFFQLERAFLLQNIVSPDNDGAKMNEGYERGSLIDSLMPDRYRDIYMPRTWYASSSGKRARSKESDKRRKHRKCHGKISFIELSRTVAARWKVLDEIDPETKKYCAMIGKRELQSYKSRLEIYKASIAADEVTSARRSSNSSASASLNSTSIVQKFSDLPSTRVFVNNDPSTLEMSSDLVITCTKSQSDLHSNGTCPVSNRIEGAEFSFIPIPPSLQEREDACLKRCKCGDKSPFQLEDSTLMLDGDYKITEVNTEFSFIPVPPSLQKREDDFLKRCQKRARLLPMNSLGLDSTSINDLVFDSTIRDLDAYSSYAINDDDKDDKMSRTKSASGMSRKLSEAMSPLQLRDSMSLLDCYKFTNDDCEMLLKALF